MNHYADVDAVRDFLDRTDDISDCTFEAIAFPAELADKTFNGCRFIEIDCKGCEFDRLSFTDCIFTHSVFDSLNARELNFDGCRFFDTGTETGCSFKFAKIHDCRFHKSDLTLCNLTRSDIYLTEFHECQMSGADLGHATNVHSISTSVELSGCSFIDCNLAYINLHGASLPEADLSTSRMSHAILDGANLTNAILADCELHQIEAEDVTLTGADLRGAIISGLDVRKIDLTGVKIHPEQAPMLLEILGMVIE